MVSNARYLAFLNNYVEYDEYNYNKRIEKIGDTMVEQTYVFAPNDQVAFVREYMTMVKYNFDFTTNTHKGILYNRINSPGRKLFELN